MYDDDDDDGGIARQSGTWVALSVAMLCCVAVAQASARACSLSFGQGEVRRGVAWRVREEVDG